ncbi:MAG: pyridoxamine 5'-phosphate oxidase family protein [Halobacteriota archaeon]
MEHVEYVNTFGMDESTVEERLRSERTGVLSLANDGRAYAVPISYVYEDGRLLVRLSEDGESKKMAFVETTDEACLVLYDYVDRRTWWSIVVTGTLRDRTEAGDFDDTAINEAFGPISIFDEDIDDVEVRVFELEMQGITGRQTG